MSDNNTVENNNESSDKPKKLTHVDYKKASNPQIEKHLLELEDYNDKMCTLFDKQRKDLNKELDELFAILGSKDYKTFMDLQSRALATRQSIQENIVYYMQKLSKANSNFHKAQGDRTEYYLTGYGIKINDGIKNKLVDRDLSERTRNIETFQAHIEFLRECRSSCDQIGYAVKNLVGLISYINVIDK
jgi:hypothetical protein